MFIIEVFLYLLSLLYTNLRQVKNFITAITSLFYSALQFMNLLFPINCQVR